MTQQKIPIYDPTPEIEELWDEINAAIQNVLRSGHFIMGPNVKAFEEEAARYLGVKHAIGLNSGTDALVIGLRAMGIGPGDEVITTPFTFFATAEAISAVGATPVFVDIDPRTFNIDAALIKPAITPRTKAIIPVHLYGQMADMSSIVALAREHKLLVLEDVAQAMGARQNGRKAGTIGNAAAFSFFPTKTLGAFGDGGMLTTNDDAVADEARMLRIHGSRKKYHNEVVGYNSRLDEMQAAVLRAKLPHLDRNNSARAQVGRRYTRALQGIPGVVTPQEIQGNDCVYHQYTIRVAGGRRDAVATALEGAGIQTMIYYPVPMHKLPIYASRGLRFPLAEAASREVLSLPMGPHVMDVAVDDISARLAEAVGSPARAR